MLTLNQAKEREAAADAACEVARRGGCPFALLQASRRRAAATQARRTAEIDTDPAGYLTAQFLWEHQAINHYANSL